MYTIHFSFEGHVCGFSEACYSNLRLGCLRLLHLRLTQRFLLLPLAGSLALLQLLHNTRRIRQTKYTGQRTAGGVLRVQDTFPQTGRLLRRRRRESHRRSGVAVGIVAVPMSHKSTPVSRLIPGHLVLRRVVPDTQRRHRSIRLSSRNWFALIWRIHRFLLF